MNLKVILTLMILVLHYCNPNMGGILENVNKGTFNYYFIHFIESSCIIAVIGIYEICIIIEYVRRRILSKILDDNIDKIKYRISWD